MALRRRPAEDPRAAHPAKLNVSSRGACGGDCFGRMGLLCSVFDLRCGCLKRRNSALTAGDFFLGRQEKVTKRRSTPALRGRLCRLPCATRRAGRLRNSGLRPSDSPRRLPPARTPLLGAARGGRKAHRTEFDAPMAVDIGVVFNLALCVVEQRKAQREKGRGLSEDRRSEFRSPPVAAEQRRAPGAAGRRCGRAFFFGYFLLGKTRRKYARASGAEPSASAWRPESKELCPTRSG